MSDDVMHESANQPGDSAQSGDQPRRSRKRGKRNRSRSGESGQRAPGVAVGTPPTAPDRTPQSNNRERVQRRSGGSRTGSHGFADGLDRSVCVAGLQTYPAEWPVNHRRGLAVTPLQEVARREGELLLCDQLHDGDCLWADGEVATGAVNINAVSPEEEPVPGADADVRMDSST